MSDLVSTYSIVPSVEFHLTVPTRRKVGEAIETPSRITMVWGHDYESDETGYVPIHLGAADDFDGAREMVQKHMRTHTV